MSDEGCPLLGFHCNSTIISVRYVGMTVRIVVESITRKAYSKIHIEMHYLLDFH